MGQLPTEDFENGNTHGWAINGATVLQTQAGVGNPGSALVAPDLGIQGHAAAGLINDLVVPTTAGHPWSGDFRANEITEIGFDYRLQGSSSFLSNRILVVLADDNGTPGFEDHARL